MIFPFNQLQKPYPIISSNKIAISNSFWVGCFVFVFLFVFQPFGLDTLPKNKAITIAGYGIISFIVTVICLLIQRNIYKEAQWTTWKQIIFYIFVITAIAYLNFIYTKSYNPVLGIKGYQFLFYTVAIGVLPITFFSITNQIQLNNKYEQKSKEINKALPTPDSSIRELVKIQIKPTDQPPLTIDLQSLLFIESQGNYLHLYQLKADQVKTYKIRGTITKISEALNQGDFVKTHRAFIVNILHVCEVKGNAQGMKLSLNGVDKLIPVSRGFVNKLKDSLSER